MVTLTELTEQKVTKKYKYPVFAGYFYTKKESTAVFLLRLICLKAFIGKFNFQIFCFMSRI